MKLVFVVLVLSLALLLAGCAQSSPPASSPSTPTPTPVCTPSWSCSDWSNCTSNGQQTRICTDKNSCTSASNKPTESQTCTYVAPTPPFQPVHLSYLFTMSSGPSAQVALQIDYYLDEKTTCNSQNAINGMMKTSIAGAPNTASYRKITVYPDSGEAVYSADMSSSDMGFDTAKSTVGDLDYAFYFPSLLAKGGQRLLSDSVWNSTKPILLKSVGAFGAAGDYSLIKSGSGSIAGTSCTNFTLSGKASNFNGQTSSCIVVLDDVNLAVMGGMQFGQDGPVWTLTSIKREKSPTVYFPQCLAPIKCPSLSPPTSDDYGRCNSAGKSYITERDENGCVTAFTCGSNLDRAKNEIAWMQRGSDCPVNEQILQDAVRCLDQKGNTNFIFGSQASCISRVECIMPPPGPSN